MPNPKPEKPVVCHLHPKGTIPFEDLAVLKHGQDKVRRDTRRVLR